MHKEEDETPDKIKESLDFLDGSVKLEKPDLMKYVDLVNKMEDKRERVNNRQFIVFVFIAAVFIAIETYSFYKSFVFFTAVQTAALLCVLPVVILWIRRRNRQVTR